VWIRATPRLPLNYCLWFLRNCADSPQRSLSFFIGLSIAKAGQALGLSESTAKRYWVYARAWLDEELRGVAK